MPSRPPMRGGKSIYRWIRELGAMPSPVEPTLTNFQLVARRLMDWARTTKDYGKLLEFAKVLSEHTDGKAPQSNINYNVEVSNPFDDIDTAQLEALRQKLIEVKPCEPDKQIGTDNK